MGTRLPNRDIQSLLGFLRGIYSTLDSEGFARTATLSLRRLVPADRSSYNVVYRTPGKFRVYVEPEAADLEGKLGEAMASYGHENPMIRHYRRAGRADVCSFSDFLSRSQFHRLPLYNEYYRHVEVEHQVAVPLFLESSTTREVGFALSRRRADFSPRDRSLLELAQPHLIQAYENSCAIERLRASELCLEEVVEANGQNVILLSSTGAIRLATRRSREILDEYFGKDLARGDRLPGDLAEWLRRELRARDGETAIATPQRPLVVVREGRRLAVRLVEKGENRALILEERADSVDFPALAARGLTRRQSEVLRWVALGKTNEAIASILGTRPATVAKHLEKIYQKLGVETRTAAAIEVLSWRGPNGG